MTSRRAFVGLALGVLAAPLGALAQGDKRLALIGIVIGGIHPRGFSEGLRDLGWIEGQHVTLEYRVWDGRPGRFPALVAELGRARVDVLVASSAIAVRAARDAAPAIPVVMVGVGDPVGAGLVASLERPGGSVTGLGNEAPDASVRRVELLKEAVPRLSRLAVLWNPDHPGQAAALAGIEAAAAQRRLRVVPMEIRHGEDLDGAFARLAADRPDGLLVQADDLTALHRKPLAAFADKHRLPAMFPGREWVDAGGLIAYGPSFRDLWRRAAAYVDRILRGARPGDLPVEGPAGLELVVNARAARALGLTLPPTLLARAAEVLR